MGKKRSYQQYCSLARALDIIGERWTLLIVRDLLGGPRRYKDLQESLDGIGSNLLAARLKDLESAGLVENIKQPPPSSVKSYQLTARGRTLEPTVASLAHWGLDLLAAPRQNDHWQPQWNHVALKARFNPQKVQASARLTPSKSAAIRTTPWSRTARLRLSRAPRQTQTSCSKHPMKISCAWSRVN